MATPFIADLHLQSGKPTTTAGFPHFLQGEACQADVLYILDDLFGTWIGDDDPNPLHQQIALAVKTVADAGTLCYFIHGNRDFLVGQRFTRQSGMLLLTKGERLDLYGRGVLIIHDDTLCTDDPGYLAFRTKVHTPWIQRLFLALPLFIRHRITAHTHANSKAANSSKSIGIMDVDPQAVVDIMERHHVQRLIHGHTHRPAVYELQANGQPAWRVVFDAWYNEGSMVKVTPDDVELIYFPFQFLRKHDSKSASCPDKGVHFSASCMLVFHDITLKERA